jgi:hypothetical protein
MTKYYVSNGTTFTKAYDGGQIEIHTGVDSVRIVKSWRLSGFTSGVYGTEISKEAFDKAMQGVRGFVDAVLATQGDL